MKKQNYKIISGVFLIALLILSACSSRTEYSQASPKKAVEYAIHLLENKKPDILIHKLASPKLLKGRSQQSIARLIESFKKRKAAKLLSALKSIDFNDTLKKTDALVVYKTNNKRPVSFIKVDKKWYIGN